MQRDPDRVEGSVKDFATANKHKENEKWTLVVPIDFLSNEMLSLCSRKLPQRQVIAIKTGEETKSRSLQYLSGLEVNGLIHFLLRGHHQNKRCHARKHVWELSDCNSPLPRGSINEWWQEIESQVCGSWVTDAGKARCHRLLSLLLSPPLTYQSAAQPLNSHNLEPVSGQRRSHFAARRGGLFSLDALCTLNILRPECSRPQ